MLSNLSPTFLLESATLKFSSDLFLLLGLLLAWQYENTGVSTKADSFKEPAFFMDWNSSERVEEKRAMIAEIPFVVEERVLLRWGLFRDVTLNCLGGLDFCERNEELGQTELWLHWRGLLHEPPSKRLWKRLWEECEALPSAEQSLILDYVEGHLASWPDMLRVGSEASLESPCWRWVRAYKVQEWDGRAPLSIPPAITTICFECILHEPRWEQVQVESEIQDISVAGAQSLSTLEGIECFGNLRSLSLHWLSGLTELRGITCLPRLESLKVRYCRNVKNVQLLGEMKRLRTLFLDVDLGLRDFDWLPELVDLESLWLSGYQELNPDLLSGLTRLRLLDVGGSALEDVEALASLTRLESLCLAHCKELQSLDGLGRLTQLHSLSCSACNSLFWIEGLSALKELRSLDLDYCRSLESIDALESLEKLERVNLRQVRQIESLNGLRYARGLQELFLDRCLGLRLGDVFSSWPEMRVLEVSGLLQVKDCTFLSDCRKLEDLHVGDCKELRSLDGLQEAKGFRRLIANHCSRLEDISALAELPKLEEVDLRWCYGLQLPVSLREWLRGPKVRELQRFLQERRRSL